MMEGLFLYTVVVVGEDRKRLEGIPILSRISTFVGEPPTGVTARVRVAHCPLVAEAEAVNKKEQGSHLVVFVGVSKIELGLKETKAQV